MKILFINPNHNWNEPAYAYGSKSYLKVRKITPPLGLGYLAALTRSEHEVKIIEANALDLSYQQVIDQVKTFMPDICAVTSMYPSTEFVIRLGRAIKSHCGVLIAGGADPTVRATDYLQVFDYVNIGQGEKSFLAFVNGADPAAIPGFAMLANGRLRSNGNAVMVDSLDELPFPAWDLLPFERYRPAIMNIKYSLPSATLMTSRGCPNRCAYCAVNTVVPELKFRSIDNVFAEIKYTKERFGATHIEFFDDTFTYRRERVIDLCERLLANNLNMSWCCVTRPDAIDAKLLRLMRRAGCYFILFGVQAVDEQVLRNINRPLFQDNVSRAIAMTKQAGIMVRLDFILGLPGSTRQSMHSSFSFVKANEPDIVDFYPVLWLPGTDLTNNYKPVYNNEELEKLANNFYRQYYFRWGFLKQMLRHCTRPIYIYRYLQCFSALASSMLRKTLARILNLNEHY